MIGAIAGDIIGSVYEHDPIKTKTFPLFDDHCRFTDDTVLTVAIADAILSNSSYLEAIREIGQRHPNAGYGGSFIRWLHAPNPTPYNSWGNGAAMRVSPVGFAFSTKEAVLVQAKKTAAITKNQPGNNRQIHQGKTCVLILETISAIKTASCCLTRTNRADMEEQLRYGAGKKSLLRYDGQSRYPCEWRQAL